MKRHTFIPTEIHRAIILEVEQSEHYFTNFIDTDVETTIQVPI